MLQQPLKYILFSLSILIAVNTYSQQRVYDKTHADPDSLVRNLLHLIKKVEVEDAEKIPVSFNLMEDVKTTLSKYSSLRENEIILKQITDTSAFSANIKSLDSGYQVLSPVIRNKMNSIEREFFQDAAEKIALQDTAKAIQLLERALQYKPKFHPAWYELIRLSLSPLRSGQAMVYFSEALKKTDSLTDPYYYNLFKETGPKIVDTALLNANRMCVLENYLAAIDFLNIIEAFVQLNAIRNVSEKILKSKSIAHQGIYDAYFHIAVMAKEAKKWQLATEYYQKATEYQKQYPEEIPNPKAFEPGPAFIAFTDKPAKVSRHYHHRPARKQQFVSKPAKLKAIKPAETIAEIHKQQKDTIVNAKLQVKNIKDTKKQIIIKPAVDSGLIMARANAREQILRSTYDAYFIVWKNQIDTAQKALMRNQALQAQYDLKSDSSVNEALNELQTRIQEKRCFNQKADYDNNIHRALNYCKRNDFISAEDQLQRASEVFNSNNSCQLNDSLFNDCVDKYQAAITWSHKILIYERAFKQKDFPAFVFTYEESYQIFIQAKLENMGLKQSDLNDFLRQKDDLKLLEEIGLALAENGKIETSIATIGILKDKGVRIKSLKETQERLGSAVAKSYPATQDKPKWLQECLHDPWYKFMTKSYLRAAKRP
ncbi:MAG: hypothetical protein WCO63_01005 [Bacteroidota bacterium]